MRYLLQLLCLLGFCNSTDLISQTTINPDHVISGKDVLPTNGESIVDTFLFYDQTKSAFRGGYLNGLDWWSPDSLGFASFAYGSDVIASGKNSVALGYKTSASGDDGATAIGDRTSASGQYGATAMGVHTTASGDSGATALGDDTIASGDHGATALGSNTIASGDDGATALGRNTIASGDDGATALGYYTNATGNSCTAVGMYNDTIVATGTTLANLSPIFIVGNGDGVGALSNALVITKNGKIGIGANTPSAAINHFTGAKLTMSGIWTDASDISKKYNIEALQHGLETISKLKPVSYRYLSDKSHSIGFVAQELEKVLPEMVFGEEGDKSIGYGQITAVLTKAIQELQLVITQQEEGIKNQQAQIDALVQKEEYSNQALMERIKKLEEHIKNAAK